MLRAISLVRDHNDINGPVPWRKEYRETVAWPHSAPQDGARDCGEVFTGRSKKE